MGSTNGWFPDGAGGKPWLDGSACESLSFESFISDLASCWDCVFVLVLLLVWDCFLSFTRVHNSPFSSLFSFRYSAFLSHLRCSFQVRFVWLSLARTLALTFIRFIALRFPRRFVPISTASRRVFHLSCRVLRVLVSASGPHLSRPSSIRHAFFLATLRTVTYFDFLFSCACVSFSSLRSRFPVYPSCFLLIEHRY